MSIPFSSWTCHNPDTIQGLFFASVKTPGQSRTGMESLLSLVSPHSAAELSPDASPTSARRQQLLKESRKCNLRKDPSYPGWFYAMKALSSFLFPLRSFLVPMAPLGLKSLLGLQNLFSRGHGMHWTGGDWNFCSLPFSCGHSSQSSASSRRDWSSCSQPSSSLLASPKTHL